MGKTNDQLEKMYLKSYRDIERVVWNSRKKTTVVILKSGGEKGIAKVQLGDRWNRELGFWVAYAKALQEKEKPFRKALRVAMNCMELVGKAQEIARKKSQNFKPGCVAMVGEHEIVVPIRQIHEFGRSK